MSSRDVYTRPGVLWRVNSPARFANNDERKVKRWRELREYVTSRDYPNDATHARDPFIQTLLRYRTNLNVNYTWKPNTLSFSHHELLVFLHKLVVV